ncbi:UBX domain-containing protein [Hypoxylon cercidicola]|nr:UBX domain-containing protein [Hypoxylon cercidicola]
MASNGDVDIGQLSPEQQSALEQYTQVTAQDIKDAIPLLQRSQWNVQIAVAKFFDGEGPDPVAEAMAAQNDIPRQPARHENLQESLASSRPFGGPPLPRARPDPAPRIVPQPQTIHRPPWLLTILFAPLNFGYRALSTFFRTFMYVFTFLPASIRPRSITTSMTSGWKGTMGRRMLMPRDTAARFKREFEEEYGNTSLPFHEGGFAQALDLAKKELKFLLIVLMSPEHDDTESFTRETLLAPEVVGFVNDPNNNIVLWGGNVLDSEAYQVAAEYNCTKFPFSCLVCLTPKEGSSTRMSIVKRLVGPLPPSAYLAELQTAVNKYAPDLAGVRAERAAQEVARSLRTEQDSAYERSLARDRERARQRREAEAAAAEAERRAREEAAAAELRAKQREQWRRWRAATVVPEPDASAKDVVRLALKMPGNDRVVRRFAGATTVEELYAFVECYDIVLAESSGEKKPPRKPDGYEHDYRFRIASPLPRVVYEPDGDATLAETIGRSGNLIVEDVIPDDDDDDDEGSGAES